jgi:hypothetical protein
MPKNGNNFSYFHSVNTLSKNDEEVGGTRCMNLSIPQYIHLSEGNSHEHVLTQHT